MHKNRKGSHIIVKCTTTVPGVEYVGCVLYAGMATKK